jgi:DNA-binding NtrC family response regulator
MKPPVLVIVAGASARAIRAALADAVSPTINDDLERGRALASTGGFLAILSVAPLTLDGAVELDPAAESTAIVAAVDAVIATNSAVHRERVHADDVGAVPYDEYVELVRYGFARRYLLSLLSRHGGSVTDAARGANMKRESLHRLMRRHHVSADAFRER